MSQRDAVIIGALLHDIGKFRQRAQKNPREKTHAEWGAEWFQERLKSRLVPLLGQEGCEVIESIIRNHHEAWEEYVSLADWISAGERQPLSLQDEEGDPISNRLVSITSEISLDGTVDERSNQRVTPMRGTAGSPSVVGSRTKALAYHRMAPIRGTADLKRVFPVQEKNVAVGEYLKHWELFDEECGKINAKHSDVFIGAIDVLLQKFCWCVPSAAYKFEPDVSLYDHLKNTAAIACCLYEYSRDGHRKVTIGDEAFLLVSGDISGIQGFIFGVKTEGGRVAKRLRARSFFVQALSEVAAHRIAHAFGNLPLCNILMTSGGNFYVLLPNVNDARERLEAIRRLFDSWSVKETSGELSIHIAGVEAKGREIGQNFSQLVEKVKKALAVEKQKSHRRYLVEGGKWREDRFIIDRMLKSEEGVCQSCHKFDAEDDENGLCKHCKRDVDIGQLIPRTKQIAYFDQEMPDAIPILGYSMVLTEHSLQALDKRPYMVSHVNGIEIDGKAEGAQGFIWLANRIPTSSDVPCYECKKSECDQRDSLGKAQPVSFDCIAESIHEGRKILGWAKGDVDDLGRIFKEGLKTETEQGQRKFSISRVTSLSRMLNLFFSGYIESLLETDFPRVYSLFSGGDDFMLIGPWQEIIDLVIRIRTDFAEYTRNPIFKLSVGIAMCKPRMPVEFCGSQAGDLLEKAKGFKGKDGVGLFGMVQGWKDLEAIVREGNRIARWIQEETMSHTFVYHLLLYGDMALKSPIFQEKAETHHLRFLPLLAYDIARNLSGENQKEACDWAQELMQGRESKNLPILKGIATYALMATRGG